MKRKTPASILRDESSMYGKFMLASGWSDFDHMRMPTYFDAFAFVERLRALNRQLLSPKEGDSTQRLNEAAAAGFFMSGVIARRKFEFFAQVGQRARGLGSPG